MSNNDDVVINLSDYKSFSLSRFIFDALLCWMMIFGAITVACNVENIVVWAAAFIVIAARQLELSHFVHAASRFNISANRKKNDLVGDIFFAAPLLITTASYRGQHVDHHLHTGHMEKDTDFRSWYNIKGYRFLIVSLSTLMGIEALKTGLNYSSAFSNSAGDKDLTGILWIAVINGGLFAGSWSLGNGWAYLILWICPLVTLTPLLMIYRVVCEHQPINYSASGASKKAESFSPPLTRSINAGFLGRFFLGSLNFGFHHEHHQYPGVNYQQLPKLHADLVDKGYFRSLPAEVMSNSYIEVLLKLIFPSRQAV
ncbi:fatty acid desaturase family protein [Litoricolaceae bacterium]|nr:fatty acid desaturase family protein [Litorivicinaceae bacterium]